MVKAVQELRKRSVISCEVHLCTNVPLIICSFVGLLRLAGLAAEPFHFVK